jgi:hypothetical protein
MLLAMLLRTHEYARTLLIIFWTRYFINIHSYIRTYIYILSIHVHEDAIDMKHIHNYTLALS